jgi:hypothetical protein
MVEKHAMSTRTQAKSNRAKTLIYAKRSIAFGESGQMKVSAAKHVVAAAKSEFVTSNSQLPHRVTRE